MRKFMMLMSAAAMAVTMPAMAQAQGKGGGKGNSAKAQTSMKTTASTKGKGQARTNVRAQSKASAARNMSAATRVDANRNGILDRFERDTDGDGIMDYREGRVQRTLDRNRNGILDRFESGSNVNFCPPGLAKKTPACVPPGQAKRMFNQGQRLPTSFRDFISREALLGRIPESYRDDIPTGDFRYIYRDNTVYVIDPRTRLVNRIIDLIL